MFAIRWIINLLRENTLLGTLALLLVGFLIGGKVIMYLYNAQITEKDHTILELRKVVVEQNIERLASERKEEYKDSAYMAQIAIYQKAAADTVRVFMDRIIAEQAAQIKKQNEVEQIRRGVYNKSNHIIKKNHSLIQQLDNE